MNRLEAFLADTAGTSKPAADGIRRSLEGLVVDHIRPFSFREHVTGLMLGHVQSGKTSHLLGSVCAAADCGIRLFVLLTVDNILLQQQTFKRAKDSLTGIEVLDEHEYHRLPRRGTEDPVLIVLKKNVNVLRTFSRNFWIDESVRYEPVFILDDEGDAASLNTKVNQGEISPVSGLLSEIRNRHPSSFYLQSTATPQALLLQTAASAWRPEFVHVIRPGDGYLGGEFFYGGNGFCQRLVGEDESTDLMRGEHLPEGMRRAVFSFLLSGILRVILGGEKANLMLVHPSLKVAEHAETARKVRRFLEEISDGARKASGPDPFLAYSFSDAYRDHQDSVKGLPPEGELLDHLGPAAESATVTILNSENTADRDFSSGLCAVVGGNSLGRGVTFPSLHTVYYCRTAKAPQADTMWQHSRAFGYDRDARLCRIYLTAPLSRTFRELTEANAALFEHISRKGLESVAVLTPAGVRPTRKAVVDQSSLEQAVGGVNYFLPRPSPVNLEELDVLMGPDDSEKSVPLELVRETLALVHSDPDLSILKSFRTNVDLLIARGEKNAKLIVRVDRNVSRLTGTLLSPNDRQLAAGTSERTVLVMYRLNGRTEDGWEDRPFWVPNIKYPSGCCFYAAG